MQQTKYNVTAEQIAIDLETLTDGIFEAVTERRNHFLVLTFTNGQRFRIIVQEQTSPQNS